MDTQSRREYADYEAFMLQHREAVWSVWWRFAKGDRARCEDMVQEVWIALWLRFDTLRRDCAKWQQRVWVRRMAGKAAVTVCLVGVLVFSTVRAVTTPKEYTAQATAGGISPGLACSIVTGMLQRL